MISVKKSAIYALNGLDPIRHVVTALVRAQRALTIAEFQYNHLVAGDITRVRNHEKIKGGDRTVHEWLIKWAISQLGPDQIEEVEGEHYQLKIPHEEVRWKWTPPDGVERSDRIYLDENDPVIWPGGNEPFSELNGQFHHNIRSLREREDLTELRESMREFGWIEQFPALKDERGVVLVGHRRLAVAKELGIEAREGHEIKRIPIGKGPEADAQRLKIAIASNIGFRPMSPDSRRVLAEYLYNDLKWSMDKVAEALRVSKFTVSEDVRVSPPNAYIPDEPSDDEGDPPRLDSKGRPNRGGRAIRLTSEQEAEIIYRHFTLTPRQNKATISREMGIGRPAIDRVINKEKGRRESFAKQPSVPEPSEPAPMPPESVEPEVHIEPEVVATPIEPEVVAEPDPPVQLCEHTWKCERCGAYHP